MSQITITNRYTSRTEEAISKYLSEIKRYGRLTPDEEVTLVQTIRRGGNQAENARKRLAEGNLRFVVSIAKQFQGLGLPLADLISEGNIGLMRAIDRFDDTRGFKFASYAVFWIRQSIQQALLEKGRFVRLPQSQQKLFNRIRRENNAFVQKHQREPSVTELADLMEMDEASLSLTMEAFSRVVGSIDMPIANDSDVIVADTLSAGNEYRTDKDVEYESLCINLNAVLDKTLDRKERRLLMLMYGIGCEKQSVSTIAEDMRLTRERVRQKEFEAIRKIRKSNRSQILNGFW
jgi:RNA polymerase primary sigma factor